MCKHICKVLIEKNVKEIPSQYILPHQRKDIKHKHTYVKNCYDDAHTSKQKVCHNKLCSYFSKTIGIGMESNEKYNFLMKCMDVAIGKPMDDTKYWESHSDQVMSPNFFKSAE